MTDPRHPFASMPMSGGIGGPVVEAGLVGGAGGRSLVVVVPMPPNLANARMHWRTRQQAKKDYFRALDTIAAVHHRLGPWPDNLSAIVIPPVPTPKLGRVTCDVHMHLGAAMDDDNASARLKFPLDWLVRRGYLTDDSRKWLRMNGYPTQTVSRKDAPYVRFTFTESPT